MSHPDIASAGDAPALQQVTVVALYDPADGDVRHLHQVFSFGERAIDREGAVSACRRAAAGLGLEEAGLAVAISHDPEIARGPVRVDISTGDFSYVEREPDGNRNDHRAKR